MAADSPLVSVVVNNHNYARYLAAAVDSALAQDHDHVEVVVVDDGSEDDSLSVLEPYGADIRVLRQTCQGQTAAMNTGLAHSSGDVVIFLDADDLLLPGAASAAVDGLSGGAVKVHWPMSVIDATGRETGSMLPERPLPAGDLRAQAVGRGPLSLPFPPTSGNAWRRTFLDRVMPLPEFERTLGVGSASADALLSMLAVVDDAVAVVPRVLSHYRIHGANDYAGSGARERIARHVAVTDLHFDVVADFCAGLGVAVDAAVWRSHSYFHRLADAVEFLDAELPRDARVVLLDGGEWDLAMVNGTSVQRFPDRDGEWWGPPADDREAVEAMERALRAADCVVVARQCDWWMDVYPQMRLAVESGSDRVGRSAEVSVYHLSDVTR